MTIPSEASITPYSLNPATGLAPIVNEIIFAGFPKPCISESTGKPIRRITGQLNQIRYSRELKNGLIRRNGSDLAFLGHSVKGNDIIFGCIDIPTCSEEHQNQIEFFESYLKELLAEVLYKQDFNFNPNHRILQLQKAIANQGVYAAAMFGLLSLVGKQKILMLAGSGNVNARIVLQDHSQPGYTEPLLASHVFSGTENLTSLVRSDSPRISCLSTALIDLGTYSVHSKRVQIIFGSDGCINFQRPETNLPTAQLVEYILNWGYENRGDDTALGMIELQL